MDQQQIQVNQEQEQKEVETQIENKEEYHVEEQLQEAEIKQLEKDKEKCLELKNKAGQLFAQQKYEEAADIYNEAIDYCTLDDTNMLCILNSNISICQMKQQDYEYAIEFCSKALEFNPEFTKALLNRAECYEKTDKFEEALEDYKKLKELSPNDKIILKKYIDLDQKVAEVQEKRKNEALNGLKDLGNTILGKFGMSLDNFKLQQNENGSYNIQFKQ